MSNFCRYTPSTASKQIARFPANYPAEIVSAKGAYIKDKEGRKYLDFCCALGPIILGYRFDEVDNAVIKAIRDEGTVFTLSHPKERALANILCEMIPCAEMVRFAQNGKDVTEAAIRLARHITSNELILSFSYHGCSDVFMACTKADKGVPQCLKLTITDFDYNDIKTVNQLFEKHKVAGVILEPHTIRRPRENFLSELRALCDFYGALLIFDEVVSFPRYPQFSAQAYFGVTPDLCCVSKGMANGYPISALVGKKKYMEWLRDNGVFFSTTFGGNLVGVSAAIATLNFIKEHNVPEYLWELGAALKVEANDKMRFNGLKCRQFMKCEDDVRQKIWQEMIKQDVFFHVPIFFNYSMTIEEMIETGRKLDQTIASLDTTEIQGHTMSEVFKKV